MTKEMKKIINYVIDGIIKAVTANLNAYPGTDLGFAWYDYNAKACITITLCEKSNYCAISLTECDETGKEHTLPVRLDPSSKLYDYWDNPFGKILSLANFRTTSDLNEVRKALFYVFAYLRRRDRRFAKKQRKLQKQDEINTAWEEHDAINASCETRSYLEDFDQAELEWETRLEALRRERRRKETLNLVNYASPVNLACYIMFLQDKIAGAIDVDVDFYTYLNGEYINFECSIAWNEYFEAEQEIECDYRDYHYYTEEDVEKWFDDHNKYIWDDYEERGYLDDFDDAERELARREVFEMVSNHGIDYLVDYIVDLHEALNH